MTVRAFKSTRIWTNDPYFLKFRFVQVICWWVCVYLLMYAFICIAYTVLKLSGSCRPCAFKEPLSDVGISKYLQTCSHKYCCRLVLICMRVYLIECSKLTRTMAHALNIIFHWEKLQWVNLFVLQSCVEGELCDARCAPNSFI